MNIKWIIWFAILTHLLWGILILIHGESVTWITAIHYTLKLGFSVNWLGITYLLIGILSIIGLFRKHLDFYGILFILPQQFLLMHSAFGAIQCMIISQFADGVIRPREFIMADQFPSIFLAVGHTCALIEESLKTYFYIKKNKEKIEKWMPFGQS